MTLDIPENGKCFARGGKRGSEACADWGVSDRSSVLLLLPADLGPVALGVPNRGTLEYGKSGRGINRYPKKCFFGNFKIVIRCFRVFLANYEHVTLV